MDRQLAWQGWPPCGVVELIGDGHGVLGITELLLPLFKARQRGDRWQLLVAPPALPYAPAWADSGIELSRLIWVSCEARKQQLWTLEHSLKSGCCSLILAWLPSLTAPEARRLQLAAQQGETLLLLHLPESVLAQQHAVALRLQLGPQPQGCTVQLRKQRGGWPTPAIPLTLPHRPEPEPPRNRSILQGPW
ncbi:hypothetical protein GCM10025772_05490 [Ferrimonas gelatinilytica]|uniref:Translesion DNA synthesis-associated protein ImuA n=1 Tax=Ferrimonas gelatinilytica TaxID=1255257 RepID=A0ABP9RWY1_9GAMM